MSQPLTSTAFTDAYRTLNTAQKQAVDTIDGPVMVIAGPGTGKTQILTLRIANILLQTDTAPESIIALTFTESGAKAMRKRLLGYIGSAAYRVEISTFHAFAQKLIARYPDAYPQIVGGQPATDIDKIQIIETILLDRSLRTLRPSGNPEYYVKPLMGMLSDLKREYITPDKLSVLIEQQESALLEIEQFHTKGAHKGKERGEYKDAQKSIEKNRALLHVYRLYESALRERRLYDFDDMIVETVQALTDNEDMLRDLQERFQYILADEHQDVNGSQNRILELLANYHASPNIFVVGDEKQAIFRFQGASLENFLYFESHFTNTKIISLTENYRSGQTILDASHDLVRVDDGPLQKLRIALTAAAVTKSAVTVREFSHQAVEDAWVVKTVEQAVAAGTDPEEIAVIVRSNREVEDMSAALRAAGLAVAASAESDILHHPITHTIEQLLRAVASADEHALFTVLHGSYWGISAADVAKVCAAQNYKQKLTELINSPDLLSAAGVADVAAIQRVAEVLQHARSKTGVEAPHQILAQLLDESGLKDYVLQTDPHGAARIVRRLYDEVEELVKRDKKMTLAHITEVLAQRRSYNLPLSAPFIATDVNAVQVMTAHKSKGLEFSVVIAPHLIDAVWGGKTRRDLFKIPRSVPVTADEADDEKRLLYVVMTRAKHELHVSSSELNADGKPLSVSRLISEIDASLIEPVDTTAAAAQFEPLAAIVQPPAKNVIDTAFIAELFKVRGFSATSLNNYLRSPWEYYFKNLLRIPQTQPTHLLFGTAVHAVLQRATAAYTKNQVMPNDQQLLSWLEQSLSAMPLSTHEYTELHAKGLEIIFPYITGLADRLPAKTEEEFSISVELATGNSDIPSIPLKGNLDRLDFDAQGRLLQVVDYKTGAPKSRNVIEGNTKSSDGAYKRQLVFYALLLELYDDERYQCKTGVLSFVESAATGALKEEVFTVTEEEIAALKKEIIDAAIALTNGSWLTQTCEPAVCDYCHLLA